MEFGIPLDRTVECGDYLVPDGWRGLGALLQSGDGPIGGYPGCQYRLQQNCDQDIASPVNVTVTGRSMRIGKFTGPAVRVKIEWVRDSEPSDYSNGWLVFNH